MKRFATPLLALALVACGTAPKTPRQSAPGALAGALVRAQLIEQEQPSERALAAMLDLLDAAVDSGTSQEGLEAAVAALDAISSRRSLGLDLVSPRNAQAFRVRAGVETSLKRLEAAWQRAQNSSWLRPLLSATALNLAQFTGDSQRAKMWRARTGCVRSAVVIGPTDWVALGSLERPLDFETPGRALAASYPGIPPFGADVVPLPTEAEGCELETDRSSFAVGLRAVVVDVESAEPRRLWLSLASNSAAVLAVGGQAVVRRPFAAGGGRVTRLGAVEVSAGRSRIVVRLAQRDDGNRIVLTVVDEAGQPVATRAPKPGESAAARAANPLSIEFRPRSSAPEDLGLTASALLALGDGRGAERVLEAASRKPDSSALSYLNYARALGVGSALPEVRRVERQREAYERALLKLPSSWEAALGLATLAGQRRGLAEGRIETLSELQKLRERGVRAHSLLDAFEGSVAAGAHLQDRAEQALRRSQQGLDGAWVYQALETQVHRRVGREHVAVACDPRGDRDSLACYEAQVSAGDYALALQELQRHRVLRDSPKGLRDLELSLLIAKGDAAGALALYDTMPPARRVSAALGLVAESRPREVRERLARDLADMPEGPEALLSLWHVLTTEEEKSFEELARKKVAEDRAKPAMPEAATLVLEHQERYTLSPRGVLQYTLFDLRRVAGTTDVDQGPQAIGALVEGRDSHRVLRKRIHKKDGRVLEPDQAAQASQEHADLSQLEQGDYVEMLVAGASVPGNMGQIVVDTPDLLPARTSVLQASVEVRYPKTLRLSRWAHRTLAARERVEGDQKIWALDLRNQGPRRLESGVPKMEQEVNVTFGTQTWANVARGLSEVVQGMRAQDPAVAEFARSAVGEEKPGPKMLEKLVAALGKKVKVSSGSALSDSAAAFASGTQETSARTILELGQGSRTWLAWQALSDLGVTADIVVAEAEPFASQEDFPAHVGRFEHPLLIVPLPSDKDSATWLDLDVSGPPLPPGKVSPELRGRTALRMAGGMTTVPAGSETGPDEVDIRVAVNERGDAKGTVTLLLRGRAAQVLLDAFEEKAGSDRKDMLRSVVLGWIPWANVDDVVMSSAEGSWQLGVRASISIPGFAQPEGKSWVVSGTTPLHVVTPQPISATIASTFAGQGARENALAIDVTWHYHLHRRIELPAGWSVQRTPAGIKLQDPHLQAERTVKVEGAVVEENFELSIPSGTIAPQEFEGFAAKARQVDDAFLASLRVAGAPGRSVK